jgi:hypothetical protein
MLPLFAFRLAKKSTGYFCLSFEITDLPFEFVKRRVLLEGLFWFLPYTLSASLHFLLQSLRRKSTGKNLPKQILFDGRNGRGRQFRRKST